MSHALRIRKCVILWACWRRGSESSINVRPGLGPDPGRQADSAAAAVQILPSQLLRRCATLQCSLR